MRSTTRFLVSVTLLSLTLGAGRASALTIGGGWTATTPGNVFIGAVSGSGTLSDAWTFVLNLGSVVDTATAITFSNNGDSSNSFFNVTFEGTNTAAAPWSGVKIFIRDTTGDDIPVELPTTHHPKRAHLHRKGWDGAAATHFECVDDYCDDDGRYDFELGLKSGVMPLAEDVLSSGAKLRLHDKDEAGTKNMSFKLVIQPVPEPGTALLLGAGLLSMAYFGRRRRPA